MGAVQGKQLCRYHISFSVRVSSERICSPKSKFFESTPHSEGFYIPHASLRFWLPWSNGAFKSGFQMNWHDLYHGWYSDMFVCVWMFIVYEYTCICLLFSHFMTSLCFLHNMTLSKWGLFLKEIIFPFKCRPYLKQERKMKIAQLHTLKMCPFIL